MSKLMWCGSDALFATRFLGGIKFPTKKSKYPYFLAMTVFAKIADFFVQEHYVVSEHLIKTLQPLKLRKPIKVLADPPTSFKTLVRKPHEGFNILYRRGIGGNQKFLDWVYGKDILIEVLVELYKNKITFNLIEVDSVDMNEVYPVVDVYVRPNRHDGFPRMTKECEQIGIPYIQSTNVYETVEFIKKHYQKWLDRRG